MKLNFERTVLVMLCEQSRSKFCANRPSRIVPGGTGFCANRPGAVVLREICGREYERIINTLFLWIYHICHTNVLQMWKIRTIPSLPYLSHLHMCDKFARILHMGDKYVRFFFFHTCDRFVSLSHSNETVTRVKNSHVFVTSIKNSNDFFTGVTNTCEFFRRLK